jgi:hypothetical protein
MDSADSTPQEPTLKALAQEGLARARSGRFFDAHESWEDAWRACSGSEKLYLQALIQAAAALHHGAAGNERGRLSLLEKARVKMASLATSSFPLPPWAQEAGLPEASAFLPALHACLESPAADPVLFNPR